VRISTSLVTPTRSREGLIVSVFANVFSLMVLVETLPTRSVYPSAGAFRDHLQRDVARRAGMVLDHEALPEGLGELDTDDAGD